MNFLEKIQNKPEHIRKRIFWVTIIIIGLILAIVWIFIVKNQIQNFQREKFIEGLNLSGLQDEINKIPAVQMPKIDLEQLEQLKNSGGLNTAISPTP